jgi:hypothetical protein
MVFMAMWPTLNILLTFRLAGVTVDEANAMHRHLE